MNALDEPRGPGIAERQESVCGGDDKFIEVSLLSVSRFAGLKQDDVRLTLRCEPLE